MKINISKKLSSFVIAFVLVLLVFSPIIYLHSYVKLHNWLTDFNQHMLWAIDLETKGMGSLPSYIIAHSGWQISLVATNLITGFSFQKASFAMALLCIEVTALIMLSWFWPAFTKNNFPVWKIAGIILGVNIATPVSMLWVLDKLMYLGYIGITSYHNPTMYLLKPFALVQFIFAFKCFNNSPPLGSREVAIAGIVSLLSTFVKPSLSICILPALGVFAINRLIKKQYVNLPGIIFGFGIPITLTLAWQFLLTYHTNDASGIEFSPFTVMSAYSKYLFLKLLLSILFPLLVLITYFKQAKIDICMTLGWSVFIFGAFFTYFLSETGARMMDGNFGWSGEIALFLLFAVSTLFYLDMPKKRYLTNILQASWLLHFFFGVAYYFYCVFNNNTYF